MREYRDMDVRFKEFYFSAFLAGKYQTLSG
jgi:hypothetical protein